MQKAGEHVKKAKIFYCVITGYCQWGFQTCLLLWCVSAKGLWMFVLDPLFLGICCPKYHNVLW